MQSRYLHPGLWSLLLLLGGCATPGDPHTPIAQVNPQSLGLHASAHATVRPDWWQQWQQPELNRAVALALRDQPSLAAARARLDKAQALSRGAQALARPQIGVDAQATKQRFSENTIYPPPYAGNVYNMGTVQLEGSWDLDLFGQRTAEIAASLNQTQAAQADMDAAALTLSSQVVKTYIALARSVTLENVLQQMQEQRDALTALAQQRAQAGLDPESQHQSARSSRYAARVQLDQVREQQTLLRHQLAALTAQGPEAFATLRPTLEALPLPAQAGELGLDLLAQRPDVTAAKWRVEAALQGVRAAEKQFYPNVSLNGFAGVSAIGLSQVFESASRQQGVGLALNLPLFDGGRLRAQLASRQGDLDMAIAQYNATVLDAVRETADALASAAHARAQEAQQMQSLQAAERAQTLVQARYEAGLGNRMSALEATLPRLEQQRQQAELQARQQLAQVELMKVLGGGWQSASLQNKNTETAQ